MRFAISHKEKFKSDVYVLDNIFEETFSLKKSNSPASLLEDDKFFDPICEEETVIDGDNNVTREESTQSDDMYKSRKLMQNYLRFNSQKKPSR